MSFNVFSVEVVYPRVFTAKHRWTHPNGRIRPIFLRVDGNSSVEHLVAAGILRRDNSILLCQRSADRTWYPRTWDLPGGHVEVGEEPMQTLTRELMEELGISTELETEPFAYVHGSDYRMHVWLIDSWSGEPTNLAPDEHDQLAWFTLDEALQLPLSDANVRRLVHGALHT